MQAYVGAVNAALEEAVPAGSGPYGVVRDAMRYSLAAGGKRIRPVLTLEFARANGGDPARAMPFACAIEMVHTYSLIHDDLPCMDDDDFRRGRPSCHKRFGEANALLAGDALLTLAFEQIASAPERAGTDPAACLRASRELAALAGIGGMVGGQVMDLENEGKPVSEVDLRETYRLKTSALLMAACRMGALAAGADAAAVRNAGEYAERLGLAFQIVDDILDVTGDAAVLGKPIGSDRENGKITSVTLLTLEGARAEAARLTREASAILSELPDSGFLLELTDSLLNREK